MSPEPLSVPGAKVAAPGKEQHQLAGLDPRERGFSRPVAVERLEQGCCARLHYEAEQLTSEARATPEEALQSLVVRLHALGYRQVKTQWSFRAGEYLGNREPWVEYDDPLPVETGWWDRVRGWFAGTDSTGERASHQ